MTFISDFLLSKLTHWKFEMAYMYQHPGFPSGVVAKNPPANARDEKDVGLIPGLGRSPGEGNGNSLQDSCLENSMDGGAW